MAIPNVRIPSFNFHFGWDGPRLGIVGDDLTRQLADYFGVKQGKGVLVREVKSGTPAEKAGLKAGDCIVRVGSTEVGTIGELHEALRSQSDEGKNNELTLGVIRNHREESVKVTLESPSDDDREVAENAVLVLPEREELDALKGEIGALRANGAAERAAAEQLRRELRRQSVERSAKLKAEAQQAEREALRQSQEWQKHARDGAEELKRELNRQRLDLDGEPVI